MIASILLRVELLARQLMPVAMALGLTLLGSVPFRVPALAAIAPALPYVAVCFWALHRPRLMPAVAAFVIGFFGDLLSGAPLGANALGLVLVHLVVTTQHRFFAGKPFPIVWLSVSLTVSLGLFAAWTLACLFHLAVIDPMPLVFEALLTVGCLPVLWWLMSRSQILVAPRA